MLSISESEKLVMDVLWQCAPLTANQIVTALSAKQSWSDKTIKTIVLHYFSVANFRK